MDEERRKREKQKIVGKKREREETEDEIRPPAVGAHGLARQDGVDVHKGKVTCRATFNYTSNGQIANQAPDQPPPSSPSAQVAEESAARASALSPSNASETSHQPPRAQPVAHYETFGDDPTTFDDPTVYDIRELTPDMTDDEKKAILCVADYPHDDLHDLTPGTPPDHDFSNAKPTNQVAFATFQTYVEPYVRHLTEEDVAFLKERGDRVEPFVMPPRGPMHYREVWAREDGHNPRDSLHDHLPLNEPRGSIEDMNDDVAATEEVSSGPLLSRLLAAFRHEANGSGGESGDANGDTTMTNGETTAGDQDPSANTHGDEGDAFQPATYCPELGNAASRPASTSNRSFASLEQRMLQELRYHGLLTPEATPDYDGHFDDEVAARLRYLQSELRIVAAENGARKTRVLELTEERMAMQEYNTIADDLDNQINAAYTKRNRTMSKPKKGVNKARPGQGNAAGVAISRNTVSEGVKILMDKRLQWKDLIGPVVDYGQKGIPKETVFDRPTMDRLMKAEGEAGEVEEI